MVGDVAQTLLTIRHPPSAIRHPPSAIRHPPSAIRHPPSAITQKEGVDAATSTREVE
ncbi:hypothetical protein [Deinococcus xianganensis]|uniref:Uncharacterized protein n=1 Tax=Deinococcus xianganensis TaxID=1507289 RepID=A0A6I4YQA9_9DEIO|nr:hypothetical protein [Deinococcus xianganensis]MXV19323.1 hypothetical protein [Deinococcus xianganensis]